MKKHIYKIVFEIKLGGVWILGGTRHVLARQAKLAIAKLERAERRVEYDTGNGKKVRVTGFRLTQLERVVTDVLT